MNHQVARLGEADKCDQDCGQQPVFGLCADCIYAEDVPTVGYIDGFPVYIKTSKTPASSNREQEASA